MQCVNLSALVNSTVVWQRHVFAIVYDNQVHRFVVHRFAASERSACYRYQVHGTEKWMENNIFVYLPFKYRPYIYSNHPGYTDSEHKETKRKRKKNISHKNKGKKSLGCICLRTHLCRESMYIYNLYLRKRMRCARNVKFL